MITKQKGYSLTELMVALSVISIMGLVAVPNIVTSMPTYRLRSSAADLCSNIRRARSTAVKQNRNISIQFNLDDRTYTVGNENKPIELGSGITFGHGTASISAAETGEPIPSDGVSFADDRITINARGLSTPGYVYLQNNKGASFAIGALASGRIVLKQWAQSDWK
jgi:prepilin-type N-terminal cleavage/methylation domain-containing protein